MSEPSAECDLYDELLRRRAKLDEIERQFLRANGWTYTCQTPGSYWLWARVLSDGRTILTSQSTAVEMAERVPSDA